MSGSPHLEEAHQVGEGVLPELARRAVLAASPEHLAREITGAWSPCTGPRGWVECP